VARSRPPAAAWQFAGIDHRARETTALRIVAVSFFALAAYVSFAALSLAIVPGLSWFERRTGRELGSASVVANSKQTLLCTYLSAVLLLGVANSLFGWSWADPIATLVIAAVALKEGCEALHGDVCCAVPQRAGRSSDTIGSLRIGGPQSGRWR